MIDLLVSLSVIAILVALMMPTLGMAREAANRLKCASNLRQIGLGIQMYTFDNKSRLPTTTFIDPNQPSENELHETVHLRLSVDMIQNRMHARNRKPVTADRWDGLGMLMAKSYLAEPRIFYCPSHDGDYDYQKFIPQWKGAPGAIVGNYQYRIPDGETLIARIAPERTLVADAMRSQQEYNHGTGNNMLKIDMSVLWFEDKSGLIFGALAETPGAPNAGSGVAYAWDLLDAFDPNSTGALPKPNDGGPNSPMGTQGDQSRSHHNRR